MIFLDDMQPGDRSKLGPITVGRAEALDFAARYDPQPFHLDDAAAAAHPFFGRLSISGWQTCALMMGMVARDVAARGIQSLGSPGIDNLRWLKPVYPGDALTVEVETLDVTPSRSKPDMGSSRQYFTVRNQHGDAVLTMVAIGLFARRPGP